MAGRANKGGRGCVAGAVFLCVIAGLDPAIHAEGRLCFRRRLYFRHFSMDHRVIGEQSDAVLRTAMPGGDRGGASRGRMIGPYRPPWRRRKGLSTRRGLGSPAKGFFDMAGLKQTIIRGGLESLYFSGAHLALKPLVGGVGAILTMHHVRPPRPDRFQPNRLLEITPRFLAARGQAPAPLGRRRGLARRDAPPHDRGRFSAAASSASPSTTAIATCSLRLSDPQSRADAVRGLCADQLSRPATANCGGSRSRR